MYRSPSRLLSVCLLLLFAACRGEADLADLKEVGTADQFVTVVGRTNPDETSAFLEPQSSNEPTVPAGRGKSFTKKQKKDIKQENAKANDGKNRCEQCSVETVPAKKHEKGVTPPSNETHVDHKIPSAKVVPARSTTLRYCVGTAISRRATRIHEDNDSHGHNGHG